LSVLLVTREKVAGYTTSVETAIPFVLDHVHEHVARWQCLRRVATDRRRVARATLHAFGPGAFGEFALHFEFAELRLVVGVGNRAGTQAVALMAMIQFNLGKTFQIQLALKFSVDSVKAIKPESASALNQIPVQIPVQLVRSTMCAHPDNLTTSP
jgi:hypothetical protein